MRSITITTINDSRGATSPARWEVVVPRDPHVHRTLVFFFGDGASARVHIEPGEGDATLHLTHRFDDVGYTKEWGQLAYIDGDACSCSEATSTCTAYRQEVESAP